MIPSRTIRRTLLLACILLWMVAAIATHVPLPSTAKISASDKVLHAVGYFVLGMVFLLTLGAYGRRMGSCVLIAIPVLLAYGALDELTQPWVNRDASWGDWIADGVGVVLAGCVYVLGHGMRRRLTR